MSLRKNRFYVPGDFISYDGEFFQVYFPGINIISRRCSTRFGMVLWRSRSLSWCTLVRPRPAMQTRSPGERGPRTSSGLGRGTRTLVRLRRRTQTRRIPSARMVPRRRRWRPTTATSRWPPGTWWPSSFPAVRPWIPAVPVAVPRSYPAATSSSAGRWSRRKCWLVWWAA